MGTGQLSQNVGTVGLVLLAVALANIALHSRRYQSLGREALLCASAYLFVQAVIRSLSTNDVIQADTARALTGIAAFCAVGILSQIAWLRRKDTRIQNGKEPTIQR
jgi:uncharacterized membrane protein YhaH (DUF805 family)